MFDQSKTIGTSLKQIPALVKRVDWLDHRNGNILNYGAGKYPWLVQDYLMERGIDNVDSYDLYNPEIDELHPAMCDAYDAVICANTLNVIQDDLVLLEALYTINSLVKEDGTVYIGVYEGDRSGDSRETVKGWQRNAKSSSYAELIRKVFSDISFKDGRFICKEPLR